MQDDGVEHDTATRATRGATLVGPVKLSVPGAAGAVEVVVAVVRVGPAAEVVGPEAPLVLHAVTVRPQVTTPSTNHRLGARPVGRRLGRL